MNTAPQSSPGKEMPGSKPDRFDAIVRNFYWLNVTRFYAGCYSKGELPSLVERLQDLASAPGFNVISHPRMLAASLLGDWVFTQNPRSVQQVVDLILSKESLRYVLAPFENRRFRSGAQNALVLPPRCGRDELIKRCFEMLHDSPPPDVALQLLELLKANSESSSDVGSFWLEQMKSAAPKDQVNWLEHGLLLGALSKVELESLQALLLSPHLQASPAVLALLFRARRIDYLHSSEQHFESVVSVILDGRVVAQPQRRIESPLDALSHAIDPGRYAFAFRDRQPIPLADHLVRRNRAAKLTWKHPSDSQIVYQRYIKDRATEDSVVLEVVQREALDIENFGTASWAPNLVLVQHCYGLGVVLEPRAFRTQMSHRELSMVSIDIAEQVLRGPDRFPGFLVTAAEERCRNEVASKVTPVTAIAEKEQWFLSF